MNKAFVLVIAICPHGEHNVKNTPQKVEMVHIENKSVCTTAACFFLLICLGVRGSDSNSD